MPIDQYMWDRLERVCDMMGRTYEPEDILSALEKGEMHSLAHNDSWCVMMVGDTPRKRVLHVLLYVGFLEDIDSIWPRVIEYAKSVGATLIRMNGRPGWVKYIEKSGGRFGVAPIATFTTFATEVDYGRR